MDESFEQLRKEIERLTRRVEALQADIAHFRLTASRFGRDVEMRERGYL
jgi:cell division septum initiation protein DivIVA